MHFLAFMVAAVDLPDPTSFAALGWVVAALFGLAAGALTVKLLFQRTPPLHQEFASKAELQALTARVDDISTEIQTSFRDLDGKRSRSIAGLHEALERSEKAIRSEVKSDVFGLHDRCNKILEAVSTLAGKLDK